MWKLFWNSELFVKFWLFIWLQNFHCCKIGDSKNYIVEGCCTQIAFHHMHYCLNLALQATISVHPNILIIENNKRMIFNTGYAKLTTNQITSRWLLIFEYWMLCWLPFSTIESTIEVHTKQCLCPAFCMIFHHSCVWDIGNWKRKHWMALAMLNNSQSTFLRHCCWLIYWLGSLLYPKKSCIYFLFWWINAILW